MNRGTAGEHWSRHVRVARREEATMFDRYDPRSDDGRDRDRVYEIDGAESRALATIGAFRVVAESDLHDIRDDFQNSRRSLKHPLRRNS